MVIVIITALYNKDIVHIIAGSEAEYQSESESMRDFPYFTLTSSYVVSFVDIFVKIDHVIMAPHCILIS